MSRVEGLGLKVWVKGKDLRLRLRVIFINILRVNVRVWDGIYF